MIAEAASANSMNMVLFLIFQVLTAVSMKMTAFWEWSASARLHDVIPQKAVFFMAVQNSLVCMCQY
jgi:hypothetical protein